MGLDKYGRAGFSSPEEALLDMKATTNVDDAVLLKHTHPITGYDQYGWVWPPEYAEKLVNESKLIEIVDENR